MSGKANGIRESIKGASSNQLLDQFLLLVCISDRPLCSIRHSQVFKSGPRALKPGPSRNVGLVEFCGEPCRISKPPQRLAPGTFMRRGNQYAIHIEDRATKRHTLLPLGPVQ